MKMFEGFEEFLIKTILLGVLAEFFAPIRTWILLIEFSVLAEWFSYYMLLDKKHDDNEQAENKPHTAKYFLFKGALYLIVLSQARGLQAGLFPDTPLTQWLAAIILVWQLKLTLRNAGTYAGIDLIEGITSLLEKMLNEALKYKKR